MKYLDHTYTKKFFFVYIKFKFNWTSSVLSGNPNPNPDIVLLSLQFKKKKRRKHIAMNIFYEVLTFRRNTISYQMVLQNIFKSSI